MPKELTKCLLYLQKWASMKTTQSSLQWSSVDFNMQFVGVFLILDLQRNSTICIQLSFSVLFTF